MIYGFLELKVEYNGAVRSSWDVAITELSLMPPTSTVNWSR
jgi:hypothetical protein